MRIRALGRSGLRVSEPRLGTMTFGDAFIDMIHRGLRNP
jgi:aryl-alcohol dehydrogenase-like predicted oxidoreductase